MPALHVALHTLRTELSLIEREFYPGIKADHVVIFYKQRDTALLAAKAAMGIDATIWFIQTSPSAFRHELQVRPIFVNELFNRLGEFRHGLSREKSTQHLGLA